jgi:hypothetical protein
MPHAMTDNLENTRVPLPATQHTVEDMEALVTKARATRVVERLETNIAVVSKLGVLASIYHNTR